MHAGSLKHRRPISTRDVHLCVVAYASIAPSDISRDKVFSMLIKMVCRLVLHRKLDIRSCYKSNSTVQCFC